MECCKASLLALHAKYKTALEVTDSDKRTSLLHYNFNYDNKKFYSTDMRRSATVLTIYIQLKNYFLLQSYKTFLTALS